ncbi:MAG: tetratricopeptide repeat protein [Candidatus Nanopelagicales bacterium]|nr:tetratricopeptide repeat protein [Candidatus Nanopelagicales bacterium]MDZ4250126.1 tetratricopeptide repeat protein [Candidatus Nanopelagicales bacterium]
MLGIRVTRADQDDELEMELLSRLGLSAPASWHDIETAHSECADFLDSVPPNLVPWAEMRRTEAEEAYVLLRHACSPKERRGGNLTRRRLLNSRKWWKVGAAAAAVVIVFGVYKVGGSSDIPAVSGDLTDSAAQAPAEVDQAQVAPLMRKISENPQDAKSLLKLADLYFQAGDYRVAGEFGRKAVAVNPKSERARLLLGASLFNQGDSAGAEKQWLKVTKLDPGLAEAHYDLGFLYLSQEPPDLARVKREWQKVVKIDPGSDLAKTVSTHLDGLGKGKSPGIGQ